MKRKACRSCERKRLIDKDPDLVKFSTQDHYWKCVDCTRLPDRQDNWIERRGTKP